MKKGLLSTALILGLLVASGSMQHTISAAPLSRSHAQEAAFDNLYGYTGASDTDSLAIFDLFSHEPVTPTISLLPAGDYPYDATLNTPGSEVWITGAVGDGVVVVETTGNTVLTAISAVGEYPVDVLFSEHGDLAFVTNRDTEDMAVIDTATYSQIDSIPIPTSYLGAGKMALNRCTGVIYTVDWYSNHFYVVDPVSQVVSPTIQLGTSLWDLVMDPSASTLYITDRGPDQVHVVDAASLDLITSINVGTDPWGIDITPDGSLLFVANEDSHNITVIDTATNTVVDTIELTLVHDPRDVDIRSDGAFAYFPSGAITGNDAVLVVDVSTLQWVDSIDVFPASNPNVVAVAPQLPSLDPVTSFISNSPVTMGTPVVFTDTTTNEPTSWEWDFGDGLGTSNEQNPSYSYANPGTYTVNLTTSNGCGSSSFEDTVTVLATPSVELSIGKTGPESAGAGEPITYTLTVTNSGSVEATNLLVTDTLPLGASYVSGGTLVGDEVNWALPNLAPSGGVATFQFVVTATETITNQNYGVVADGGFSATGERAVTTTIVPILEPVLSIVKSGPSTAEQGELITYTLTIANSGNLTATNLLISDTLPAGATYVSGGTLVGDVVSWTHPSLDPLGGTVEYQFVVTATETITNMEYSVSADGGYGATGTVPVTTVIGIIPPGEEIFLPIVFR